MSNKCEINKTNELPGKKTYTPYLAFVEYDKSKFGYESYILHLSLPANILSSAGVVVLISALRPLAISPCLLNDLPNELLII